ncbi:MAG: M20/M25/M40 family metallo-hydrolase [Reyranella sp.]|jgi:glutamate carboxypeptidase|uniref:M20/M25/M40 family metallo-hydrolase n=1 Tax=Reyranella sp. TaxID=1929291 RepID=UPI0025DA67CF|nr:M20/M25/M40 family metallo-hydrolase [Reyranella sp.]MBR2815037.1 M20/M25/M40 family metallo-hydrolase [Reyranella sp.]
MDGDRNSRFGNSFSSQEILEGIMRWASVESPSVTPEAVARMFSLAESEFRQAGASIDREAARGDCGPIMRARFPGRQDGPGILVLGHLDTVHPLGTIEGPLKLRVEGDKLYGPGVFDMKGGIYLALYALNRLRAESGQTELPVTFMMIPDEELGSPNTRHLIEQEAARHKYVLVPEPARLGKLVSGRHAFVRYTVKTYGKPAHAGADNKVGRSAIRGMARLIETIESATDMSRLVSFSVGVVNGGLFVNVIPTECTAQVLCVASSPENLQYVYDFMASLKPPIDDVVVEVIKGAERPLFQASAGTLKLFEIAKATAADVGIALEHGQFGGGSDGNFTGAMGVPTLDGLGVVGAGAHTHDEHLVVSQLAPRARIFAGLLAELN